MKLSLMMVSTHVPLLQSTMSQIGTRGDGSTMTRDVVGSMISRDMDDVGVASSGDVVGVVSSGDGVGVAISVPVD